MSSGGILQFTEKYPNEPSKDYMNCRSYDVVPTTAFIQGVSVYSLAESWGMRYVFTGGDDGFVRKYDMQASVNGGQLLTVSQKHMLPDTITKAGVLCSYWENEQPLEREQYTVAADKTYIPRVSPVYALEAQSEALWVCAGLESGGISLQSATYGEMGQVLAYLNGHNKTVSDLQLNRHETEMLSGSWDRSIGVWDMNAGVQVRKYRNLASQVSSVDWQPRYARIEPNVEPSKNDDDDDDDKSMESLFGSDEDAEEAKDGNGGNENSKTEEEETQSGIKESKTETEVKDEQKNLDEEERANAGSPNKEDAGETGNVFMSSAFNGLVELWDKRQPERIASLSDTKSPPWCMSACFSTDGSEIYAGRRNACVEGYDLRKCNEVLRTLKFPSISGAVSCVARMPNNRSLLCASLDNIRLFDLKNEGKIPFTIIPGHHGTVISRMLVDKSGRFMVSASGGRGWAENSGDIALAYEIEPESA